MISTVVVSIYIPTPFPSLIVCRFFENGHSDWCDVILQVHMNLFTNGGIHVSLIYFVVHLKLMQLYKSAICKKKKKSHDYWSLTMNDMNDMQIIS